jgi:hypothetical protein
VVTGADAMILVAPAESVLATFNVIEATPWLIPSAYVNAVAEAGVNVTMSLVAMNVTTAPSTRFPLASRTVAVAVTGVPNVKILEGMLKIREAALAEGQSVPVHGTVTDSLLPHPLRQQKRTKRIRRLKKDKNFFLVDFAILLSFF